MTHYVYIISNLLFDKHCYIGKSIHPQKRFRDHANKKSSGSPYLQHAMRKYGIHNFSIRVISAHENEQASYCAEIATIAEFKKNGYVLYNLTNGGEGSLGTPLSEERKKKISDALKGRPCLEKTKLAVAAAARKRKGIPSVHPRPTEYVTLQCTLCNCSFQRRAKKERSVRKHRNSGPFCGVICRNRFLDRTARWKH